MRAALVSIMLIVAGACARTEVTAFAQLDRDGDGRINEREAREDSLIARRFRTADINGDGELSAAEYIRAATL
jgi:Ca2+-binding EF-hand superfamily protein